MILSETEQYCYFFDQKLIAFVCVDDLFNNLLIPLQKLALHLQNHIAKSGENFGLFVFYLRTFQFSWKQNFIQNYSYFHFTLFRSLLDKLLIEKSSLGEPKLFWLRKVQPSYTKVANIYYCVIQALLKNELKQNRQQLPLRNFLNFLFLFLLALNLSLFFLFASIQSRNNI